MDDEVFKAARNLVAAFSEGRLDDYFAAFAPEANFIFHTTPFRVESTAEYRLLWSQWVAMDGFRVLRCVSSNGAVSRWSDTGVFTHDVETEIETKAGAEILRERETIVFRRHGDGRWLAVHEHLSPAGKIGD